MLGFEVEPGAHFSMTALPSSDLMISLIFESPGDDPQQHITIAEHRNKKRERTVLSFFSHSAVHEPGIQSAEPSKQSEAAVPDLYLLRTYYFQAEAAIDNGQLYAPGQRLYVFSDYALYEMIQSFCCP